MKKMKKVLAMILSLAMVLAMSVTAFAGGTGDPETPPTTTKAKPVPGDTKLATAENIEKDATVTAYQIVKANYNDLGFTGYEVVKDVTIANKNFQPTSDEITEIARKIKNNELTLTPVPMTAGTEIMDTTDPENPKGTGLANFTANLNAGYWVVLVTGTVDEVYNPMLIGVAYSTKGSGELNELETDPVDANSDWELVTKNAYAKSTEPKIEKTILESDQKDHGNDVAIGDIVKFQIKTLIPSYSAEYSDVVVKIKDTLTEGLTYQNDVKVSVGGKDITEEATGKYTLDETGMKSDGGGSFTITFDSIYALSDAARGKEVIVTYSAKVNDKAALNIKANENTAELEYSNDPTDSSKTKKKDDKTYTYTFGIDATLFGETSSEWNKFTKELLKTGEERKIVLDDGTETTTNLLDGAKFTLTKDDDPTKTYTATSGDNGLGMLTFTGLDSGEYTLQETKAPEGYSLNKATIPVKITAEFNDDGTLKSYSISVNNTNTSTYKATYKSNTKGEVEEIEVENTSKNPEDISHSYEIQNTKLTELPSTGGIGTTIFTIGGCIIMIVAAGLFFASRRKKAEN